MQRHGKRLQVSNTMVLTGVKEYNSSMNTATKRPHRVMFKPGICNVDECINKRTCWGFCNAHYLRLKRHGTLSSTNIIRGDSAYHPLKYTYKMMLQRCYNPNATQYKDYGGRGIKVCDRWNCEGGFTSFVEDMGEKTDPSFTLDRVDVNGNYEPSNCKWSSKSEQQLNRRPRVAK